MPNSTNLQAQDYTTSFGGPVDVRWNGTHTGDIILYCPIPTPSSGPTKLYLAYKNNTTCVGCSADTVTVAYIKMNKTTGAITTVATLNTSGGVNNGSDASITGAPFSDTWDISTYAYYLRVDVQRASSSNDQQFTATAVF